MFHCVLRVETETAVGAFRAFLASAVVMIEMANTFFFFAPAVTCAPWHQLLKSFFFTQNMVFLATVRPDNGTNFEALTGAHCQLELCRHELGVRVAGLRIVDTGLVTVTKQQTQKLLGIKLGGGTFPFHLHSSSFNVVEIRH
jgi:hypothetical protein